MCNNKHCQKHIAEENRTKINGAGAVFLTYVKGVLCVVLGLEVRGPRTGTYSLPCGTYEPARDNGCPFITAQREIMEEMGCNILEQFKNLTDTRVVWLGADTYNLMYIFIQEVKRGLFRPTKDMSRIAYVPVHAIISMPKTTQMPTIFYGPLAFGGQVYGHKINISKFTQTVIIGMFYRNELSMFGLHSPNKREPYQRESRRTYDKQTYDKQTYNDRECNEDTYERTSSQLKVLTHKYEKNSNDVYSCGGMLRAVNAISGVCAVSADG